MIFDALVFRFKELVLIIYLFILCFCTLNFTNFTFSYATDNWWTQQSYFYYAVELSMSLYI